MRLSNHKFGITPLNIFTRQLLVSLIIVLALLGGFASSAYAIDGCSSAGFKIAPSLSLEAIPYGIAVADFNGDGHLDLAATNNGSSEVAVLFGRGGMERFGPPHSYPTAVGPEKIVAGDFNGDGKPDLITTHIGFGMPDGRFSVLLNDGSGHFGAPNIINLPFNPYQPVAGDLNNDGKLDIVVGLSISPPGGRIAVLLGDGAGGFSHAANSPFITSSANVSEVVIGDFNEDGKRDLALPGSTGGVDLMLGDGTGAFAPAVNIPTTFGHVLSLTMADFNGDGHLDLVSDSQMLLGNGTGNFSAPININLPGHLNAAIAGDVNNDGHIDLIGGGVSGLTVMLENGAGNFTLGKSYTSGTTIYGAGSSFAALGDFNEDGKMDIAAVQQGGISILDGDGTGAFNDALSYKTSISNPRYLVTADFNNDGKQDFAALSRDNLGNIQGASSVEVGLGDANGGFTKKPLTRFQAGTLLSSIATADFNKDGKFDLAVTQPFNGKVSILLNDGTGGFPANGSTAPSYSTNPYGFQPSTIRAGDFNNDGNPDLIAITPNSNNFVVLLGNGTGSFTVTAGSPLQGSSSVFDDLAIADFNADGKSDLAIIRHSVNGVYVLQGDGSGHFSGYVSLQTPGTPVSVVARDLNGDGKPDIAVSNSTVINGNIPQAYVSVFINNGAQGFSAGTNYPSDGAGILGVGDFNSDGQPDLAVGSGAIYVGSNLDGIAVLSNKGSGIFDTSVNFSAGPVSDYLVVSDFNNDGKDDVIFTQPNSASIAVLLNNFSTALQCLSINDVTVTETDAGTTDAVFTVKLSAASAQTVRVNYYSVPRYFYDTGTANKGADFESIPGTLTFNPGETTQTISVPVKGDSTDELDEHFYVRLSTPIGALISDARGLGTIIDNDSPPALSVNDASVSESHQASPAAATFTVSLSAASEKPISVQYALAQGTATSNTDYSNVSGTLEFPAGTTSKTFSVPIKADNMFEANETFSVNLSNATNATIADGQGQGTIINDDPQPGITISAFVYRTEGAAGTTNNAGFDVTLSNPSYQAITVNYTTANGTASGGSDYTSVSGTLTFNPGESTKTISVQINGDNVDEIDETFFVNLSGQTNSSITKGQGLGTIFDDDGPTMSINDITVAEGNAVMVDANFTVTLSAASVQDVYVNYATSAGTASSNVDYPRLFGTLAIPAGATSGIITTKVFGDYQIEPDETFFVTLSFPQGGTIADGQGVCTITNDDAPGKLQFSAQSYSVNEGGSAIISVTRTDGGTGTVTVDYATGNGTADAGIDYLAASGTLTFNQGETSKTFSIGVVGDVIHEGDETVNLTLSTPTGGAILGNPSTALLTIINNDSPTPQLQFSQPSYPLGEAVGSAQVIVNRTDTTAAATVDYATSDAFSISQNCQTVNTGIASSRCDYATSIGTLRFAAGETSKTIYIPIVDDNIADGNETFNITLSNPSGASLGIISSATVTITDNANTAGNPIDTPEFFIRQHYIDFLGREPEPAGLAGWLNVYNNCGTTVQQPCDRTEISSAFFRSPEFQERAYLIYRFYSAVGKIPLYEGFMPDFAKVSGFLSAQELEANKVAFVNEFMTRPDFQTKYGALTDPAAYVDALLQTVGLPNHPNRGFWTIELTAQRMTRAQVLRGLVESTEVYQKYYTEAFVIMQYFGYLRRSADISYLNWIETMNTNGGDYRVMINGFLNSAEYRNRFGN